MAGFIGYHLCKRGIKKGWKVHSLSKNKPKKNRKIKGVKYILCNIENRKLLKKKLNNYYDYIINSVGYVDHSKNKKIMTTHFKGCQNLALNFLKRKPKKFIQLGSSIEYGKIKSPQKEIFYSKKETTSIYGKAKLYSTNFLLDLFQKYFFPVTILRLYLVYGPNQDFNRIIPSVVNNCLLNNKFNCSPGTQMRDFLFIDDLVELIFKILKIKKTSGEILNAGYGRPIRIRNLILMIKKMIGKGKPNFNKLKFRSDEILNLYPNVKKVEKLIAWKASTNIKKGLKKTIYFYKKRIEKNNLK